MMKGKLVKNFKWQTYLAAFEDSDSLQFEEMYEAMQKWAISPEQQSLDYQDFSNESMNDPSKMDIKNVDDFKRMTDQL